VHDFYVVRGSQQLEPVDEWDLAFHRHDLACPTVFVAEVGVTRSYDPADEISILLLVEEANDLFWNTGCIVSSPVGWND
jgi:hypothetical protein